MTGESKSYLKVVGFNSGMHGQVNEVTVVQSGLDLDTKSGHIARSEIQKGLGTSVHIVKITSYQKNTPTTRNIS